MRDESNPYPKSINTMGMEPPTCSRDPATDHARRKELMQLADTIAVLVEGSTHPRERCMLRRMVEMLLGD